MTALFYFYEAIQIKYQYFCKKNMQRSILYFFIGTVLSFLLNYFLLVSQGWIIDLYNSVAFGLGWAMAYFVDRPQWSLSKKMGISFVGIVALLLMGFIFFDFKTAVPSIIKFSTVFVGYYLIASLRSSKSLRD